MNLVRSEVAKDFYDPINYAYLHFTGGWNNLKIEKLLYFFFVYLFVCCFTCVVILCPQFELLHIYSIRMHCQTLCCVPEIKFFCFVFVVVSPQISLKDKKNDLKKVGWKLFGLSISHMDIDMYLKTKNQKKSFFFEITCVVKKNMR